MDNWQVWECPVKTCGKRYSIIKTCRRHIKEKHPKVEKDPESYVVGFGKFEAERGRGNTDFTNVKGRSLVDNWEDDVQIIGSDDPHVRMTEKMRKAAAADANLRKIEAERVAAEKAAAARVKKSGKCVFFYG